MAVSGQKSSWKQKVLGCTVAAILHAAFLPSFAWLLSGVSQAPHLFHSRRVVPRPLRAAPWDFLKGSVLDMNYWKQQYFMAGQLKTFIPPNVENFRALQLAPNDAKHLGYLCPNKEKSLQRMDNFIVVGEVDKTLKTTFEDQAKIFKAAVIFKPWSPGKVIADLRKESIDIAVISLGTAARLKTRDLKFGLTEIRKALKPTGRLVIVVSEEDETVLGGKLEAILDTQELQGLEDLRETGIPLEEAAAGQILRETGLRLVRALRDESGIAIGVCVPRDKEQVRSAGEDIQTIESMLKSRSSAKAGRSPPAADARSKRPGPRKDDSRRPR